MTKNTIRDAIIEAISSQGKPLSSKEIYQTIINKNLYKFNAKSPESLVTSEIRRHCEGLNLKTSSDKKYFKILKDGTYTVV